MKKNLIILFLLSFFSAYSQITENGSCERPLFFCRDTSFNNSSSQVTPCPLNYRWYYFNVGSTITTYYIQSSDSLFGLAFFGPFTYQLPDACPALSGDSTAAISINSTTPSTFVYNSMTGITTHGYEISGPLSPGYYYVRIRQKSCLDSVMFTSKMGDYVCPPPACEDCIGSFSPGTEKKYMVSAWAKRTGLAPTVTSYTDPKLSIISTSSSYSVSFYPSGSIIDGWQKIDGEFTLPSSSTDINIKLECLSGDCFFDDIRVFPFDGSMKSYVYDPVNMRLVAELDERNYATLYEYDEEGKLVRVKKETEKGIMTIKENRNNSSK